MWIIEFAQRRPPLAFVMMTLLNLLEQVVIGGLSGATLATIFFIPDVVSVLRHKTRSREMNDVPKLIHIPIKSIAH